jgi:hypothetical protein
MTDTNFSKIQVEARLLVLATLRWIMGSCFSWRHPFTYGPTTKRIHSLTGGREEKEHLPVNIIISICVSISGWNLEGPGMGLQLCLCNNAGARVELVVTTPFVRILDFLSVSKNCLKKYFLYFQNLPFLLYRPLRLVD